MSYPFNQVSDQLIVLKNLKKNLILPRIFQIHFLAEYLILPVEKGSEDTYIVTNRFAHVA